MQELIESGEDIRASPDLLFYKRSEYKWRFFGRPREPIKILIVCADAQSVIEKSCKMWYTVKNI